MTKRSADTVAEHESVPAGALPFCAPSAKRSRSRGGAELPPSPSDPFALRYQAFQSSSDEMSDAGDGGAADQVETVSIVAHHLAAASSCSISGLAGFPQYQSLLSTLGIPSAPACPDAQQFLEQLAACMRDCQKAGSTSAAVNTSIAASIGITTWHSFAELNVVLSGHFPSLPTAMLRGYHSFTRAPRAQLWSRFAASQGPQLGEDCPYGRPDVPVHLSLTRFLLEHVLAAYPTASCVVYTIEVPAWLRCWCARWGAAGPQPNPHGFMHHPGSRGGSPPGVLRVLALFAYAPEVMGACPAGAGGSGGSKSAGVGSSGASPQPPRVMYVPCADW